MIESIIGKEFPAKVIPLINNAKRSIDIIVFDWRWYPNDPANPAQLFNAAVIRAKNRGVKIRAIMNVDQVVKILNGQGCEAKHPKVQKLIHAKMMIIDGEILILGSHNYTQNAFTLNQEVSCILQNACDLAPYQNYFNHLFA